MQQLDAEIYAGGFEDPARQAARAFRAAMDVMARPGEWRALGAASAPAAQAPVRGLSPAAATLLLTLCDPETGVYLAPDVDSAALRGWLRFHTGAPLVDAEAADFAVGGWAALLPLERFRIGTPEYPDRSATLIVEMDQSAPANATLRGPGIRDSAQLRLPDVAALTRNAACFPLGVDLFLTSGAEVAALPRSSKIAPKEE